MGKKSYTEETCLNSVFPYDVSKSCSDLICQSYSKTYDLKIGILRCANLYGPGDLNKNRLINGFIISTIKNKTFRIRSNGKLVRDYLFIDDAVNAYYLTMLSLIKKNSKLRIYNVGSKYNMNVFDMIKKISKLNLNKQIRIKVLNTSKKEILTQKLNYRKISKELNWKQYINLNEGLRQTYNWYQANIKFFDSY